MISGPIILDTHILLWTILTPDEISEEIKGYIELAQKRGQLFISAISLWEIAMLKLARRIHIYEPMKDFLNSIVNVHGLVVIEISPEIISESISLMDDFSGDSLDRMIVATAKCYGAALLTRDQALLRWAEFGHIKSLEV